MILMICFFSLSSVLSVSSVANLLHVSVVNPGEGRMPDPMTAADLRDLVCLTMVPGVGPHTSRALLERFGTAGRALDASVADLCAVPKVGPKLAAQITRARRDQDADAELELCRRAEVRVIPQGDDLYPPPL